MSTELRQRACMRVYWYKTSMLEVRFSLPDGHFYCCLISETLELLSAAAAVAAKVGGGVCWVTCKMLKETESTNLFLRWKLPEIETKHSHS